MCQHFTRPFPYIKYLMFTATLLVAVILVPITDEEAEEQSNFPIFTSLVSGRVYNIIHNSTKTQQTAGNGLFSGGFKNLKLSISSENDLLAVFGL